MNPIRKIKSYYKDIKWMKWNLLQAIWFNFHYLPFKQAVHLPILLHHPHFRKCKGRVILAPHDGRIYRGMIKIGIKTIGVSNGKGCVWENAGTIIFLGPCTLGAGVKLAVFKTGQLVFEENFYATDGLKIVCGKKISLGKNVLIGWDTTIMDTNQHQLSTPSGEHIGKPYAPIEIGEATWCGFGCTILPGTIVPNRCVVASKSLLNKKYNESYTLLAGCPARIKARGVWRNPSDDKVDYTQY